MAAFRTVARSSPDEQRPAVQAKQKADPSIVWRLLRMRHATWRTDWFASAAGAGRRCLTRRAIQRCRTAKRGFSFPWRRMVAGAASACAIEVPSAAGSRSSVVELAFDALFGHAVLWGIAVRRLCADYGIGLRSAVRGRDV